MQLSSLKFLIEIVASAALMAPAGILYAEEGALQVPKDIEYLLEDHCWKCHEAGRVKGDIQLDNIPELALQERLALFNRMHEQVFLHHMPPKDEKSLPTQEERDKLMAWIKQDLDQHKASTLEVKLQKPEYGNYINHEQLFSGECAKLPAYTPDRRWLMNGEIFNKKMNEFLRFDAGPVDKFNRFRTEKGVTSIANPFDGVGYADAALDGGHLLTMLANARSSSSYMMRASREKTDLFPPVSYIMRQAWKDEDLIEKRYLYLMGSIEELLIGLYGQTEHERMLPQFKALQIDYPKPFVEKAEGKKKGKKKAKNAPPASIEKISMNADEKVILEQAVCKFIATAETDEDLLNLCEREWFIFGYPGEKITSRLMALKTNMPLWRAHAVKLNKAAGGKSRKSSSGNSPDAAELELIGRTLKQLRKPGDTYLGLIDRATALWDSQLQQKRVESGELTDKKVDALVVDLIRRGFMRDPQDGEVERYRGLFHTYLKELGQSAAVKKIIETFIIDSEFVYRMEFGVGQGDEHGRRMMPPRDAAFAIAYTLTFRPPDAALLKAADEGKLASREDYQREVKRILSGGSEARPVAKLRFFQQFFEYPKLDTVFKDNHRFGGNYAKVPKALKSQCDQWVNHVLKEDRKVFETLLSSDEYIVYHNGNDEQMRKDRDDLLAIHEFFKNKKWDKLDEAWLKPYAKELEKLGLQSTGKNMVTEELIRSIAHRVEKAGSPTPSIYPPSWRGRRESIRGPVELLRCFNLDPSTWNYPVEQPAAMPTRAGILTHPAWLIAFSKNFETDIIHRGKWVREKLLAGTIPDVPISVDASIPEDHTKTMRNRVMEKTEVQSCWKCHEHMNPLGYAFEMYDDFGRFRTEEPLEHPDNLIEDNSRKRGWDNRNVYKTLPIVTTGRLDGTGDPKLDGEVENAIELAHRLAKSERVRQSIIRHAFRYFLGRNEMLSDSKTLMDAERAYLDSGGSFDAVVLSLLSSDSFIYRKSNTN